MGCVLCILGSLIIVLHAPEEREPESVQQIWALATAPLFMFYCLVCTAISIFMIVHTAPRHGYEREGEGGGGSHRLHSVCI
jgi:hypothetical protein